MFLNTVFLTTCLVVVWAGNSYVIPIHDAADLDTRLTDAQDKLVVICFMSSSSAKSKAFAPQVKKLAKERKNLVTFVSVDFDKHGDIVQHYEVQAVPTFVFMRYSEELEQYSGKDYLKFKGIVKRLQDPPKPDS